MADDPSPPFSPRDRELLEALAQQRVAVLAQVAHWLGVSEATAGRRVAALHRAGLLERQRLFAGESAAVRITEAGLKRIGSRLGRPGRKLDEHRHDVGVGWVWTAARGRGVRGARRDRLGAVDALPRRAAGPDGAG